MKKIIIGCIGAGLAAGAAYMIYKRWRASQIQSQEKHLEVCNVCFFNTELILRAV